ncbi:hypothetical protein [Bacillus bingmayongensis]|uniref:hypothetical protein n=1 Tax=Bacillus bingmayongensis TaxID=1150157 RepID=UPI0002EF79F7|nr:hypothetical protein [Bacillus bingmayongensis]MBY0600435.1 hypothetical protein [Bacillus bingmayongensis]
MKNLKAKAAITKNIEKSFSKIVAKIEKEQEKQADAIAKENKKVDQNTEVNPAQPAQPEHKLAVSHEKYGKSNQKGQTEKNDHQDNGKKVGQEKYEK